jgi:hypothetical protein
MEYGMFTPEGNAAVHGLVLNALRFNLEWSEVYDQLADLGTLEGFSEATDTEVREAVYMALQN